MPPADAELELVCRTSLLPLAPFPAYLLFYPPLMPSAAYSLPPFQCSNGSSLIVVAIATYFRYPLPLLAFTSRQLRSFTSPTAAPHLHKSSYCSTILTPLYTTPHFHFPACRQTLITVERRNVQLQEPGHTRHLPRFTTA
jgi:hypothetical protein